MAGVVSTQSRSERRRTTATRARSGRFSNTRDTGPFRPLFFDFSLVDQHDRDFIPDGVHPMTLNALQSLIARLQFNAFLTQGTDEYLKQFLADTHKRTLVYHGG